VAALRFVITSYAEIAAQIVSTVEVRPDAVRVIGVDGWSGAGKTVVATRLASELRAPLIAMDDFVPGWDGLHASVGLLADWVLEPLAAGRAATWRLWDWSAARFGATCTEVPAPLMVVEGCGAGSAGVRSWLSYLIWIEADPAVRAARLRSRPDWAGYEAHAQRWASQERALRATDDVAAAADMVIDGDRSPMPTTPGTAGGDPGLVLVRP
jgi:predicted kinase